MPAMIFWQSSATNCVAHFHTNLYDLPIVSKPKIVSIPDSFLRLCFLGGLLVLFFFIATVTSFWFFTIPPVVLLVTISFIFGLFALLGDVAVYFSTHMLHFAWLEAYFEVLAVHSIE